jgi:hypothetical protein
MHSHKSAEEIWGMGVVLHPKVQFKDFGRTDGATKMVYTYFASTVRLYSIEDIALLEVFAVGVLWVPGRSRWKLARCSNGACENVQTSITQSEPRACMASDAYVSIRPHTIEHHDQLALKGPRGDSLKRQNPVEFP